MVHEIASAFILAFCQPITAKCLASALIAHIRTLEALLVSRVHSS
jgi:hypothetical protein